MLKRKTPSDHLISRSEDTRVGVGSTGCVPDRQVLEVRGCRRVGAQPAAEPVRGARAGVHARLTDTEPSPVLYLHMSDAEGS